MRHLPYAAEVTDVSMSEVQAGAWLTVLLNEYTSGAYANDETVQDTIAARITEMLSLLDDLDDCRLLIGTLGAMTIALNGTLANIMGADPSGLMFRLTDEAYKQLVEEAAGGSPD